MTNRRPQFYVPVVGTLFFFAFILCNWNLTYRFAYDSEKVSKSYAINHNEFLAEPFVEYDAAGFPLTHYLRIRDDGFPDFTVFFWHRWFSNLAIWSGLLCAVLFYHRSIERRRSANGSRQLYVTDLFMITSFIAACLAAWRFVEAQSGEEQKLSETIAEKGGCMVRSLWFPGNMLGRIAVNFNRTRAVQVVMKDADDALLRRTLQLERLTSLCLDGGDYDLQILRNLGKKPLLRELRISGRDINPELIQAISRIKQLNSLNLMNTNVTADDLHKLNGLPRLKYLNLLHTSVRLSEIATLPFANTLHGIVVPHPENGESDRFEINGWPRLEHFVCNSRHEPTSKTTVSIELRDLPCLSQVKVDCLQTIDLKLSALPSLTGVDVIHSSEESWRKFGGLRTRNLVVEQLPRLKSLKLHGPDLETIELREPNLESLAILDGGLDSANSQATTLQQARSEKPSPRTLRSLSPMVLLGLAKSAGPSRLEIYGDLSNASLEPILQNKSIKTLDLSRAILRSEQLSKSSGIQNLTEVWLGDICISGKGEDATWITQEFIKSSQVHFAGRIIGPLDLENNHSLTTLRLGSGPWPFRMRTDLAIDGLRLFRVTNLKDSIRVQNELSFLQIDGAPSITGLWFDRPLPKGASLKGLRDLTHFNARGANLTDEVLSAVLECPNLAILSIADANVSKEVLSRLASLTQLQSLDIDGTQLDESVLRDFVSIPSLKTLVLRNAKLDKKSIEALINAPERAELSLYLVQCEFEKKLIVELANERPSFQVRTTPPLKELERLLPQDLSRYMGRN